MNDEQPRIGAYERPAARTQVRLPSVPAQNLLNGDLAGSPAQTFDEPVSAGSNSSEVQPVRMSHPCTLCNRSFSKTSGLARHMTAHRRNKIVIIEPLSANFVQKCQYCEKSFIPGKALSQHHRQAHIVEYNANCLALMPATPYNWTEHEDARLLSKTNELSKRLPLLKDILEELALQIPNRTKSSLRSRLRLLKWSVRESRLTRIPPSESIVQTQSPRDIIHSTSFSGSSNLESSTHPSAGCEYPANSRKYQSADTSQANASRHPTSSAKIRSQCSRESRSATALKSATTSVTAAQNQLPPGIQPSSRILRSESNSRHPPPTEWSRGSPDSSTVPQQLHFQIDTAIEQHSDIWNNTLLWEPLNLRLSNEKLLQLDSASDTSLTSELPISGERIINPFEVPSPEPLRTRLQSVTQITEITQISDNFVNTDVTTSVWFPRSSDPSITAPSPVDIIKLPDTRMISISSPLKFPCNNVTSRNPWTTRIFPTDLDEYIPDNHHSTPSKSEESNFMITTSNTQTPIQISRSSILQAAEELLCTIAPMDDRSKNLLVTIQNGITSPENFSDAISLFWSTHFPLKWKPRKPRITNIGTIKNKRELRRKQYGHIQNLFKHNKKDAAATVLDGRWRNAFSPAGERIDGFDAYWSEVFNRPPSLDSRPIHQFLPTFEDLGSPFSIQEVTAAATSLHGSAAGMDKISTKDLLRMDKTFITALINALYAAENIPSILNQARVTFIPKVPIPTQPHDFRPISITSVFLRLFHKMILNRWIHQFPTDRLQFGFLKKDGCFEATTILHATIRNAHSNAKSLSFANLDISKAFDMVSHDSIVRAAVAFGAPPILLAHLRDYYKSATSHFGDISVHPHRGVRQGDPLSPLLFIMVLDEALSANHYSPWQSPGGPIDYLAYADDVILFAADRTNLALRLELLQNELLKIGLSINFLKSSATHIVVDGKRGKTLLDTSQTEFINGRIPSTTPTTVIDFLGIRFDWRGKLPSTAEADLERMLLELSKAPLKPHQRLEILRVYLLPRFTHTLTLSTVHKKMLKHLDLCVRKSLRKWLRLPTDTATAFFYASINDGGMGIPHLSSQVLLNRRARIERHLHTSQSITNWAIRDPASAPIHRLACSPIYAGGIVVATKEDVSAAWKNNLHQSVDGSPLARATTIPAAHHWFRNGQRIFPRLFIRAIQLRAGVLSTKSRRSRGREIAPSELKCRGSCDRRETLSHILQTCSVTHDSRCRRHNDICLSVLRKARSRKLKYVAEPHITTTCSFIKPDIVFFRGESAYVADVAICDADRMEQSYKLKLEKYGSGENGLRIATYIRAFSPTIQDINHIPLIFNNRGFVHPASARHLSSLGFSKLDISDLCVATIQGCIKTYDAYMRGPDASPDATSVTTSNNLPRE